MLGSPLWRNGLGQAAPSGLRANPSGLATLCFNSLLSPLVSGLAVQVRQLCAGFINLVLAPALTLTCCVALGKSLSLSGSRLPHGSMEEIRSMISLNSPALSALSDAGDSIPSGLSLLTSQGGPMEWAWPLWGPLAPVIPESITVPYLHTPTYSWKIPFKRPHDTHLPIPGACPFSQGGFSSPWDQGLGSGLWLSLWRWGWPPGKGFLEAGLQTGTLWWAPELGFSVCWAKNTELMVWAGC